MSIRGIDNMTADQLESALAAGGRFVVFEYCISLVFISLRQPSPIVFLQPGDGGLWRGLRWTLLSLLLGWWGIPWGVIYTPLTVLTNLSGGRDVTPEVWARIRPTPAAP